METLQTLSQNEQHAEQTAQNLAGIQEIITKHKIFDELPPEGVNNLGLHIRNFDTEELKGKVVYAGRYMPGTDLETVWDGIVFPDTAGDPVVITHYNNRPGLPDDDEWKTVASQRFMEIATDDLLFSLEKRYEPETPRVLEDAASRETRNKQLNRRRRVRKILRGIGIQR